MKALTFDENLIEQIANKFNLRTERTTPMLNLNTLPTADITTITWEAAPEGFDQTGTLYNTQLSEIDGIKLILGHDIDSHKSSIAAEVNQHWYDTAATKDWPVFDHLFGRKAWKSFVAEHAEQAIAEIEADLDDEE